MQYSTKLSHGTRTFLVLWAGQAVSYIGTAMTRFALLTWAYAVTGSATTLALLGFFSFILYVLVSPFAGVVVDRYDRRLVMIFTDTGAGLMTMGLAILYFTGRLEIWHLFVAEFLTGGFEAFQRPAYISASTMLVPKEQYGRLNALRTLAFEGSRILGPFLASLLLITVSMGAVFIVDMLTFAVAVVTLLIVRIPAPRKRPENQTDSLRADLVFGFHYIRQRRGLLGLMILFTIIHLIATLTYFGVMKAMILARSGGDTFALASVEGALGAAGVVGGLVLGIWGGPKKQIHMLMWTMAISFLFGDFLIGIGQTLPAWIFGAAVASFFIPFIVSAERTIWQRKVAPDAQGRVFSMRTALVESTMPIGFLLAGPLADKLFEPALRVGLLNLPPREQIFAAFYHTPLLDGTLVDSFGRLVGTGPGAGMGLMFVCTALLGMTSTLIFYAIPAVRHVEDDLPDHDEDENPVIVISHELPAEASPETVTVTP